MSSRVRRSLSVWVLVLGTACADSIVRILAPDNDPQVVDTPEKFQFTATDLRNVNDRVTAVWPNPAAKAKLTHDSFIHHFGSVSFNQESVDWKALMRRLQHLLEACVDEFRENEDLPNTTNPDDWARISGKKGERIVFIRTLVQGKQGTEAGRSIESVANTGQYL